MNALLLTALAGLTILSVSANGAVNVKDFGAKGNGMVDDSVAIQKAMDAANAKGGGIVELGVGRFRLDNPLSVPEGVTLSGVWEAPHHAQLKKGTVFLVYAGKNRENSSPALITLNPSSAVKGITFFYPEQRIPGTISYPWTIQGKGMHGSVENCTFVNSYKAIDFGTNPNELHFIRNCFGCPLKVGVFVDQCTDIGRIENVHFNPHYWGRAEVEGIPDWNALLKYLNENLIAFDFGRSDWEYVLNTFVFGAKIGYHFYESKNVTNSGTTNGNFLGIGADWCDRAIKVDNCQPIGLLITNGEFVGAKGAKAMTEISPTNSGLIQYNNCSFWGPSEIVALIEGSGTVSYQQCNFLNYVDKRTGAYTIEAGSGNLTIENCRFAIDSPDIHLGKGIKTAIIAMNRFQNNKDILNESEGGDIQEGLNVTVK